MRVSVGDGFYTFCQEFLGRGYELQKRWVSELSQRGFRHIGGAVDIPHNEPGWPWNSDPDPKKAFAKGKKNKLAHLAVQKEGLRKKLQELAEEERKMRSLRFDDVKIRGDKETYEQFKRGWDMD